MNLRHITRFTYEFTNFQGWRVAISRQGTTLARYFSDKQYGSSEAAREQAVTFRDTVLEEIRSNPAMTREILYKYRVKSGKLSIKEKSDGLNNLPDVQTAECRESIPASQQSMLNNLKKLCHYLKLDTVGMLRFSVSLFIMQYAPATAMPLESGKTTQTILSEMSRVVSDTQLRSIVDILERNHTALAESFSCVEQLSSFPQVPAEEIRAKESTSAMHNTSPPEPGIPFETVPSPGEVPPRSEDAVAFDGRDSRAAHLLQDSVCFSSDIPQYPHPQTSLLLSPISGHSIEHHKPAQFDQGLEYAEPWPTDVI